MKYNKFLQKFKESFFNLNWTCNICDNENFNGQPFCDECYKTLPFLNENYCARCGRKTIKPQLACDSCIDRIKKVKMVRSIFNYEEPIDKLIKDFKYNGKIYLAEIFAKELSKIYFAEFTGVDCITYVPMTLNREEERGYNQSYLLAKNLSKIIGVEVLDCVKKREETLRQALLNANNRKQNLKGTFYVDKRKVKGKKILLIDDVMTTGSTIDVISSEMIKKQAEEVYCLTIASVSKVKDANKQQKTV